MVWGVRWSGGGGGGGGCDRGLAWVRGSIILPTVVWATRLVVCEVNSIFGGCVLHPTHDRLLFGSTHWRLPRFLLSALRGC